MVRFDLAVWPGAVRYGCMPPGITICFQAAFYAILLNEKRSC